MLAKKFRLTGSKDFRRIEEKGTTFQSRSFGIAYLDRGDIEPSRYAFVVSTKVARDAVDRNTIRRHMSETVRMMTPYVVPGHDIVFLTKTSILSIPADAIMREVRGALKESGLAK